MTSFVNLRRQRFDPLRARAADTGMENAGSANIGEIVPHAPGRPRNLPIAWLRLFAAIAVMLFHASGFARDRLGYAAFSEVFGPRLAIWGVALFFSISGYLMSVGIRAQSPFVFLAHRAVRIYPLLWLVYIVHHGVFVAVGFSDILDYRTFLLIPYGQWGGPLGVDWSVIFEISFYICIFFAGLTKLAPHLHWIALGWLGILALNTFPHLDTESPELLLPRLLFHPACVPLATGLIIPYLLEKRVSWAALLGLGVIACGLDFFVPPSHDLGRWCFGVGTSLFLAGGIAVSTARPAFGDNRLGRGVAKAADYTYALYLCHLPIILAVFMLLPGLSPVLLWCGGIAASLLVAAIAGETETIVYRRLKAWVTAVNPLLLRVVIVAFLCVFLITALSVSYEGWIGSRRHAHAQALLALLQHEPGQDAKSILGAAGFVPDDHVIGNLELATQVGPHLKLRGWALEDNHRKQPLTIVVFRGGRPMAATATFVSRPDVRARYHRSGEPGFEFDGEALCPAGADGEIYAVGKDGVYARLPNVAAPLSCP